MRVLAARCKFLRGTALDPFGRTEERKMERALIVEYEALVQELIGGLTAQKLRARDRTGESAGFDARLWSHEGQQREGREDEVEKLLAQWRNNEGGEKRQVA